MDKFQFSTQAAKVVKANFGSMSAHPPIKYSWEFLNRYRPNKTFYLDEETREELHRIGNIKPRLCMYSKKFVLDLSWNSSRLEGGTYSLLETERILNSRGSTFKNKDLEEITMIKNHREAINFLLESAKDIGVRNFMIYNLHALLSQNLIKDPKSCGQLRKTKVHILGSRYVPMIFPQMIQEAFERIISLAKQIKDPFEESFFLLVHLPYLQPFLDVNKRVSRLAANIPLLAKDLCPFTFVDVDRNNYTSSFIAVYEQNKIEPLKEVYVWGYKRSCARYSGAYSTIRESG